MAINPDFESIVRDESVYNSAFENTASGLRRSYNNDAIPFRASIRLWLSVTLAAVDVATITLAAAIAFARFKPGLCETAGIFLVAGSFLVVAQWSEICRIRTVNDVSASIRRCGALSLVWLIATATVSFLLSGPAASSSVVVIVSAAAATSLASRIIVGLLAIRFAEIFAERALIVGRAKSVALQVQNGSIDRSRLRPAGVILVGEGSSSISVVGVIGGNCKLGEGLSINVAYSDLLNLVDRIFIVKDGLDDGQLKFVMKELGRFSSEVHLLEEAFWGDSLGPVGDMVSRCVRSAAISPGDYALKRTLDVIIAMASLALLAPAMILIGFLIRCESQGPALFKQTRLGCNNLPFTVLKFRTMRHGSVGSETGSVQARRNDSRVTWLGGILRKMSIDELPQLLNVLGGSMSLVGPRPHPTDLNRRFEPLIDCYAARHSVPPGITGWAQVNGSRGETPTKESMQRRVDFDLDYIQRRSTGFDLWIIFRTFVSVVAIKNVY